MPRDGSGNYSLPLNWETDRDNNIKIRADRMMQQEEDIGTALTGSMPRNGEAAATGVQNMGGFRVSNVGSATSATDAMSRTAGDDRYLLQGKHTVGVPAAAITARTSSGPESGTAQTSTNKVMLKTLDFGTTAADYAQFMLPLPKSTNLSTGLTYQLDWLHDSTSGSAGVVWAVQAAMIGNGNALDASFGSARSVTDTGGTKTTLYRTAESSAVPVTGSASDTCVVQVYRNATASADTLGIPAKLLMVRLYVSYNVGDDS